MWEAWVATHNGYFVAVAQDFDALVEKISMIHESSVDDTFWNEKKDAAIINMVSGKHNQHYIITAQKHTSDVNSSIPKFASDLLGL